MNFKKTKVFSIILVIIVIMVIIVAFLSFKSYAFPDSYEFINLNSLTEIKDNKEMLKTVKRIEITHESDLSLLNLITSCTNIYSIYINNIDLNNLEFINNVKPAGGELSISLNNGTFDLKGIDNPNLTSLYFSIATIKNFEDVQNLINLNHLSFSAIYNADEIYYDTISKLLNLEYLEFLYTEIIDYQDFFESINKLNKLNSLNLQNANIQNKDVISLKNNRYIKELNLKDTMIDDISFLEYMPNIERVSLPAHVVDFSVLYNLKNIKGVYWDNYTEYMVTKELVEYFDENNIEHTEYYPELKITIDELVEEANILKNDNDITKFLKVTQVVQDFASIDFEGTLWKYPGSTTLSQIVLNKKGVCANWSALVNTLLNIVGVESYKVTGYLGEAHAWNLIKIDGNIYAVDVMNALPHPDDYFNIETWNKTFKAAMLRDPIRIDSYRESYALENNLDYNYDFAVNYKETDGIATMKMFYDFKNIDEFAKVSKYNIWLDKNTEINSLKFELLDGLVYKYYDKHGNVKQSGLAETGDYIVVSSAKNINYSHKYQIIVNEIKTYEINLDSNGSFGKNEKILVTNGGKYIGLFEPIRYCYKFLGWYTKKDGGTLITKDSIVDVSQVNTLYAHWEYDNKVIVTLDKNGSGYADSHYIVGLNDIYRNSEEKYYGFIGIPRSEITDEEGKKFAGWYTKKEGGNLVVSYSTLVETKDHTLYAHWVDENETLYKITIHGYDEYEIEKNHKIASLFIPIRDGYTFAGWYSNSNLTNKYDFSSEVTSDMTLYAKWIENSKPNYIITFNSQGGSLVTNQTIQEGNRVVTPVTPTKDGYTFAGWYSNSNLTNKYDFSSEVTSDMTLYAKWESIVLDDISNIVPYKTNEMFIYPKLWTTTKSFEINNGYTIEHFSSSVLQINSKICTGDKIIIYKNGNKIGDYTAIITGDISGDGLINSSDLLKIRQHLLNIKKLNNEYYVASDINYDNSVNSADLFRLRQHLLEIKLID